MVYVDTLKKYSRPRPGAARFGRYWCHLGTDGEPEELHRFAAQLGLRRQDFQAEARTPHYDLTGTVRARAVNLGARQVTGRLWIELCRKGELMENQDLALRIAETEETCPACGRSYVRKWNLDEGAEAPRPGVASTLGMLCYECSDPFGEPADPRGRRGDSAS